MSSLLVSANVFVLSFSLPLLLLLLPLLLPLLLLLLPFFILLPLRPLLFHLDGPPHRPHY